MKRSVVIKYVLPFLQWYSLMILLSIVIDYLLHYFKLVWVGRYLGIIGTVALIISLLYSLRKRKIITSGSPKQLLNLHEYVAWAASVMLLVHAGIHFNAVLPWLAVIMMMIVVASGLVGKFLLKKATASLKESRLQLIKEGLSQEDADKKLFFDSITVDLMKKWRIVHLPLTLLFALLALMHIISILIFSK